MADKCLVYLICTDLRAERDLVLNHPSSHSDDDCHPRPKRGTKPGIMAMTNDAYLFEVSLPFNFDRIASSICHRMMKD